MTKEPPGGEKLAQMIQADLSDIRTRMVTREDFRIMTEALTQIRDEIRELNSRRANAEYLTHVRQFEKLAP